MGRGFQKVRENKIKLEPVKLSGREQIREACAARFAEVEGGYVEGFWGGREDFKLPAFIAQMIDSLTELSGVYNTLAKNLTRPKIWKKFLILSATPTKWWKSRQLYY